MQWRLGWKQKFTKGVGEFSLAFHSQSLNEFLEVFAPCILAFLGSTKARSRQSFADLLPRMHCIGEFSRSFNKTFKEDS